MNDLGLSFGPVAPIALMSAAPGACIGSGRAGWTDNAKLAEDHRARVRCATLAAGKPRLNSGPVDALPILNIGAPIGSTIGPLRTFRNPFKDTGADFHRSQDRSRCPDHMT